jgi:hypothetical protein
MHLKRILAYSTLALVLLPLAAACTATGVALAAGAAAGAATAAYVQGDLQTDLDATPTEVAAAAESAFQELRMPLVSSESTEVDGRVEAKTAREKRVLVVLESLGEGRTKTAIRVGTFGDESLSRKILDRIREHLRA